MSKRVNQVDQNLVDRFVGFFSAEAAFRRARYRKATHLVRKYEAASGGRRTKNWKAGASSANAEIHVSLPTLRNRARQMVRDNPYASRGLQVITSNVVGRGIFSQVKVDSGQTKKTPNTAAENRARELQKVWLAWSDSVAVDYEERLNLRGMQRLVMREVVESGEVFVRLRRTGKRKTMTRDGVIELPPIQLQVLESDHLDLTGAISIQAEKGNTVIQGIEYDRNGNRVAYHFFKEHPGNGILGLNTIANRLETVRVPASEVLHIYRVDRAGQSRGVTWFAPVMLRLRDFDEYEDAQLFRQKIAAMFAVFIKDLDGITGEEYEGELGEKVEPGIIEILPPGKDISFANPPGVEGYGEYTATVLRSVAAGLGITYESMTGDLSQVNFSSARMGFLDMHRNIDEWRNTIMELQFLNPVFDWWANGMEILGYDLTRARAVHTAPRREMVDPAKEISAQKEAVRSGFLTLSDAIRNTGSDPERHFEEIEKDNAILDAKGLILDTDPRRDADRIAPAVSGANDSDS